MERRNVSGLLTSVDSLFTTQSEREDEQREKVMEIPLVQISDFAHHPFQVRVDESMNEMAESVRQFGILTPALVRPKPEGGYEMVSGHRRRKACELAGRTTIPCIVREMSDDEAIIRMVDTHLQREQILPSEKAFAYRMKLEAMKRQGQRTDLTSVPAGQKLRTTSREMIANSSPDSNTQIQRYIRLTHLNQNLLDLVDEGKIAMRPAVELSYLSDEEQNTVFETMDMEGCTPNHAQAIKLRRFSEEGKLSQEVTQSILQEEKANQREQFKLSRERIGRFFPPGTSPQKMEDTIVKALELYRKRQRSMER